MFGKRKTKAFDIPYDEKTQRAVVKCSICTGEQVAGFKNIGSGKFTEVCLIRDEKDLQDFLDAYGLGSAAKEY